MVFNLQPSSCLCLPRAGCQACVTTPGSFILSNCLFHQAFLLREGWDYNSMVENLPCECEALDSVSGSSEKGKIVIRASEVAQQVTAPQNLTSVPSLEPCGGRRDLTSQSCPLTSPYICRSRRVPTLTHRSHGTHTII